MWGVNDNCEIHLEGRTKTTEASQAKLYMQTKRGTLKLRYAYKKQFFPYLLKVLLRREDVQ